MTEDFRLKVADVLIGVDPVVSKPTDKLIATFAGIVGDRHLGQTKAAGIRESKFHEKGTEISNARQWSAIEHDELCEIATAMGVEEIKPEWLGANLLLRGVSLGKKCVFTKLPPLTRLIFPSGCTLVVYGENEPCKHPAEAMLAAEPSIFEGKHQLFGKAAIGRRGLVGWVEREGDICPGDEVSIFLPKSAKPGQIVVTPRMNDFHACLSNNTQVWACGETPDEAVGALIRTQDLGYRVQLLDTK